MLNGHQIIRIIMRIQTYRIHLKLIQTKLSYHLLHINIQRLDCSIISFKIQNKLRVPRSRITHRSKLIDQTEARQKGFMTRL